MEVFISTNGEEVSRYIGNVNTSIGRGISDGIQQTTAFLAGESAREAPVDTGRLKQGITQKVTDTMGTVFTSGKSESYAKFVHQGTRPHSVDPSTLEAWARRKGLNPYLVARSIRRKGTKANPFFTRAVEQNAQKAVRIFSTLLNKAINDLQ